MKYSIKISWSWLWMIWSYSQYRWSWLLHNSLSSASLCYLRLPLVWSSYSTLQKLVSEIAFMKVYYETIAFLIGLQVFGKFGNKLLGRRLWIQAAKSTCESPWSQSLEWLSHPISAIHRFWSGNPSEAQKTSGSIRNLD